MSFVFVVSFCLANAVREKIIRAVQKDKIDAKIISLFFNLDKKTQPFGLYFAPKFRKILKSGYIWLKNCNSLSLRLCGIIPRQGVVLHPKKVYVYF